MARPSIEPRTSDLRVRCPTDSATRPGSSPHRQSDRSYLSVIRLSFFSFPNNSKNLDPSRSISGVPIVLSASALERDTVDKQAFLL